MLPPLSRSRRMARFTNRAPGDAGTALISTGAVFPRNAIVVLQLPLMGEGSRSCLQKTSNSVSHSSGY